MQTPLSPLSACTTTLPHLLTTTMAATTPQHRDRILQLLTEAPAAVATDKAALTALTSGQACSHLHPTTTLRHPTTTLHHPTATLLRPIISHHHPTAIPRHPTRTHRHHIATPLHRIVLPQWKLTHHQQYPTASAHSNTLHSLLHLTPQLTLPQGATHQLAILTLPHHR